MCTIFFARSGIRSGANIRRLAISLSSNTYTSAEFFINLPLEQLAEWADDVFEMLKE